jgi:hypothetical protein
MEHTNFPMSRNVPLERLVTDALGEIERLGYSRRSRNRYIEPFGSTSSSFLTGRNWEMSGPEIWRCAF